MGRWVAIDYTSNYNRGRKSGCRSLRNVCVRVRDSLISRGESFGSLKEEHLFMIDALCAACTSFRPERISKINLTLDKSPDGCELLYKFAETDVLHTLSRPFVGQMKTFKDQIYQARGPVLHLIILLVLFLLHSSTVQERREHDRS
jgi:hypothetical protein